MGVGFQFSAVPKNRCYEPVMGGVHIQSLFQSSTARKSVAMSRLFYRLVVISILNGLERLLLLHFTMIAHQAFICFNPQQPRKAVATSSASSLAATCARFQFSATSKSRCYGVSLDLIKDAYLFQFSAAREDHCYCTLWTHW